MLDTKQTDRLMENAGESVEYVRQYVQQQVKLTKLNVAETAATTISGVVTGLALGLVGLIALLFLSVAIACFIAQAMEDNYGVGFLIVFGFYALVGVLLFVLRRKLVTDPAVNSIIKKFFPPTEEKTYF